MRPLFRVPLAQAVYYVISGIWPVVSMSSFEMVTGPKRDRWLVRTVGLLATVIGLALGRQGSTSEASGRGRLPAEVILGAGSALAFATIDAVYVAKRRISRVYLADAAIELAFLRSWLLTVKR
jgi:hypothetical protein